MCSSLLHVLVLARGTWSLVILHEAAIYVLCVHVCSVPFSLIHILARKIDLIQPVSTILVQSIVVCILYVMVSVVVVVVVQDRSSHIWALAKAEMSPWPKPRCHSGQSRDVTLAKAEMSLWPEPRCCSCQSRDVTLARAEMLLWPEPRCDCWPDPRYYGVRLLRIRKPAITSLRGNEGTNTVRE